MNSSRPIDDRRRIVVDSVHGDIELDELHWRVIDTATFQRLRFIKQLGMGHLVYPNATHTRFAHSLGVFHIMSRILKTAKRNNIKLPRHLKDDLPLAALLHDIGHYPYSHLMENIDAVQLIEEFVRDPSQLKRRYQHTAPYPKHVELGQLIVTSQADLLEAIGGEKRAKRIADLFGRTEAASPQWSKLINSSFDMDRLDYLLRDSQAAGVPYGAVDLNYLLNSLKISPKGLLGVVEKALPAVEQLLLARYFMFRAVYWHKTTLAFEEAARQLLRRIRDQSKYGVPANGAAVEAIAKDPIKLRRFTDAYLDNLIEQAAGDDDECISTIAKSLLARRPAKLLHGLCDRQENGKVGAVAAVFRSRCKGQLAKLAKSAGVPLWRFMYYQTPRPFRIETRGPKMTEAEAHSLPAEMDDDLIKVFRDGEDEPVSLVGIDHSIIGACASGTLQLFRLYVIDDGQTDQAKYQELRETVARWASL